MKNRTYRDKVAGCWIGKCLAGAIGMPFEGVPYQVDITEDKINIQDVPNDDLELQLIWMAALKKYGTDLRSKQLGEFWLEHIPHGCDEYSIALRNMQHGVMPPLSGYKDNFFADGMGAAIRSEIWAAVFPGQPEAAAYFAEQDASVDHWGDGVWAEIFMAAAESIAFVEDDIAASLKKALAMIPDHTRLFKTLDSVIKLYESNIEEEEARRIVREKFYHHNFTDCVMNLSFIVFSLLWGRGDFIKTIMSTVRFGRDTDCTAASCGAFLGICRGVPEEWSRKVNEKLTLSHFVEIIPDTPKTLSKLIEETIELNNRLKPDKSYPAYEPVKAQAFPPAARWLILDESEHNIPAIKETLLKIGKCPEELKKFIAGTSDLQMDLSSYAKNANTLNLFSFLEIDNAGAGDVIISATADVGLTLWIDDKRVLNHHSRQLSIASFHRAEGGAAFLYPLKNGGRYFVHLKLYNCFPPLKSALMFGNIYNDHLDGFNLSI